MVAARQELFQFADAAGTVFVEDGEEGGTPRRSLPGEQPDVFAGGKGDRGETLFPFLHDPEGVSADGPRRAHHGDAGRGWGGRRARKRTYVSHGSAEKDKETGRNTCFFVCCCIKVIECKCTCSLFSKRINDVC